MAGREAASRRDGTRRDLGAVPVRTHGALGVHGGLLRADAGVGDLDDVLQLPGLLLHLGCQEQRGLGNDLGEAEEGVGGTDDGKAVLAAATKKGGG